MTRRSSPSPSAEQGAQDHARMMARLKTLTGDRKPLERVDPALPNDPVKPIAQTPVVPNGYVAELPKLEWLSVVRHPNSEATQTSSGGVYAVFGRRGPQGFVFTARRGLDVLGEPQSTAEAAREICQRHYLAICCD